MLREQFSNNVTYLAMQDLSRQTTAVTLAGPDEEKFTNYLQIIIATINDWESDSYTDITRYLAGIEE